VRRCGARSEQAAPCTSPPWAGLAASENLELARSSGCRGWGRIRRCHHGARMLESHAHKELLVKRGMSETLIATSPPIEEFEQTLEATRRAGASMSVERRSAGRDGRVSER